MLAAVIAISLFGAPKPMPCPSRVMVQCQDTRALRANPGFEAALHDFLGASHERLLHGDRPLYDQVMELMARPDGHAAPRVGDDMRLYAGCRKMACPEKAAVIVGQFGIMAVGLIDYTHGDPALEVIVRRADSSERASEQALRVWAESVVSTQADHDHANTSLHDTRVRALDEEASAGPPVEKHGLRSLLTLPRL
ncbi:MAG TPA: hypothetical protein VGM25_10465 [Caulobacteraceae bacterium]|jgi:hypothetical protein